MGVHNCTCIPISVVCSDHNANEQIREIKQKTDGSSLEKEGNAQKFPSEKEK